MKKYLYFIILILLTSFISACAKTDDRIYMRDYIYLKSDISEGEKSMHDISTLKEANLNTDSDDYDHQYFNGAGELIDPKELKLGSAKTYLFEDELYQVEEVLLKPLKLTADYKVSQGMRFNRNNDLIILTNHNLDPAIINFMQSTFAYNDELSIYPNYNRLDMYLIPEQVVSFYFSPIVYKITYQDHEYYALKTCISDSDYKLDNSIYMAKGSFTAGIFDIVHRKFESN